jgi:alkylation response protein AidB-like acyl-CoA dehydrogenase
VSDAGPAAFPRFDPVGPATPGLTVPHADVLADVVAEGAVRADASGVERSTLDTLAGAGLLGSALRPAAVQRELGELMAGSDATTWFCWVQHQTPLRTLEGDVPGLRAAAPDALRQELLPGMRAGRILGAVAFAHVRRPGPPDPVATRVPGGWRLDGSLDWITSWDIADVVMVMAQAAGADDGSLVCCYLPAGRAGQPTEGLTVGAPLRLLSMSGTHTRPARLEGVFVPDDRVGAVLDRAEWLAEDAVRTTDANPAAFGVSRGAIAELAATAQRRSDERMTRLVGRLVDECRDIRARAYASADDRDDVSTRLGLRAAALDLTVRASAAVVVAQAGAAMRTGSAAERRVREAMFLLVQAQTQATRGASIDLMLGGEG